MKNFLAYSLGFLLSAGGLLGASFGGWGCYSGLFLFFVIHPLFDNLDLILKSNSSKSEIIPKNSSRFNSKLEFEDFFLFLSPLFITCALLINLNSLSNINTFEFIGLALSMGATSGVLGINIAHELVHRKEKWSRFWGVYLLMTTNFAHWGISHVAHHHKHVATPLDSATAKINEPIFAFWFRAYWGGIKEAYLIDLKRNKSIKRVYLYFAVSLFASLLIFYFFDIRGLFFWWAQSCIAILLLETVDYIEHYGLTRKFNSSTGMYEAFKAEHAWDSYRAWTNYALFKLGFHSHHHLKANLHYSDLRQSNEARQLPFGYSLMALIALIPPLFFKLINPLLKESDPK